jgi:tryptophan synthase alpha chain
MGVTGVRNEIKTDIPSIAAAARPYAKVPLAVGFGINTPHQAAEIARYADGVIVGSAIVKIIAEHGYAAAPRIAEYVTAMKKALKH